MLSVVINTWNEEQNLPRAISSVKKIAGEIVVVDCESTDKTVAIARRLGAKVFHHKNSGIVEPVRNFAISKARGDWILLLDADEELPDQLVDKIPELIADSEIEYYRLPRKNLIFGKWITSEHWWPDYSYRLFRKGAVTWDDAIHSIPFTRGQGCDIPDIPENALIHHNYSSVDQYITRLNRYTDFQLKQLEITGYNFRWSDIVKFPISEFLRQYFARKAYRDGLHGLALSGLQAFSEFVLYLKLWGRSSFIPLDITPPEFARELHLKATELKWWQFQAQIETAPLILKPFLKLLQKFVKS